MPFVYGFLRKMRRPSRPGHPDTGLPEGGNGNGDVDPDYGIDEGGEEGIWPGLPDIDPPKPPMPPPGIWPPLTPDHPWQGLPGRPGRPPRPGQGLPGTPPAPGQGLPEEPPTVGGGPALPPGTIWPPLPPGVTGHYLALVLIGGGGKGVHYRYVVVDADARPELPMAPGGTPQPK